MNLILLDTHAAIWSANGTVRRAIAKLIDGAASRGELLLSPITAWEIGMLAAESRLILASTVQDYVRALFRRPGVVTATLTPLIAASASSLPQTFPAGPADRIIFATAQAYGAQLVTRDALIHAYSKQSKALRCIAC